MTIKFLVYNLIGVKNPIIVKQYFFEVKSDKKVLLYNYKGVHMEKNKNTGYVVFLFSLFSAVMLLVACGESPSQDPSKFGSTKPTGGLSAFEVENGIGPVKAKLTLDKIDPALVIKGKTIFDSKCAACHKLDDRYVGPAQRDVTKRRSAEYIINMMMNPEEMYKKHPEAKKMLAEYMTQMPNQNITMDEARAVLEYFRQVVNEKK